MTDELWTPSDELLLSDPIAKVKVENPFDPPEFEESGMVLPDMLDEHIETAAASVLAELDDDDVETDEPGDCEDDGEVDDPSDTETVGDDV